MTLVKDCEGVLTPPQLIDLDATPELLVLVADELDQLLIGQIALIDPDGPRFRVRLRIVDSYVDLQVPERGAADALSEFRLPAVRAAIDVEPSVVGTVVFCAPQIVGFDDKRVAIPTADRVAVPPGLRLALRRKRPAIEIDVAYAVVGLVLDENQLLRLDDLARLRLLVELQESHR